MGRDSGRSLRSCSFTGGEVVSADRIADELWGERPPETAIKTVQVYVSRLRKELGEGVLVTRGGGYVLEAEPDQVDVERFERLAAEGREALDRGEPAVAAQSLTEALELCRGPPLADFTYEPFAQNEIARLEELQRSRSKTGSRPTWRSAATTRSLRSSRPWSPNIRPASGCAVS